MKAHAAPAKKKPFTQGMIRDTIEEKPKEVLVSAKFSVDPDIVPTAELIGNLIDITDGIDNGDKLRSGLYRPSKTRKPYDHLLHTARIMHLFLTPEIRLYLVQYPDCVLLLQISRHLFDSDPVERPFFHHGPAIFKFEQLKEKVTFDLEVVKGLFSKS